jgi:hypothetical protein
MRLRLLKVLVQPIFVIDDGETLVERAADTVVVPAAEWPTYASGPFAEGFELLRRQIEGRSEPTDVGASSGGESDGGNSNSLAT